MNGPILKGKKVILRPTKLSEAKNYVTWLSDSEVTKFLGTNFDLTLEQEKEFIKKIKNNPDQLFWAIYTKSGKHIGNTSLNKISQTNQSAIWGIVIGDKNEWDKGYGTDTLKTVIKYFFEKLKLNRFELAVYKNNKRALKSYLRCGLKKEGLKRQSHIIQGRILDDYIMSMLKSEYKLLKNK